MQGACKVPGSDTSIEVALMPSQIRMPGGRTLGILILSRRWPEQTDNQSGSRAIEHLTLLGSSDTIAAKGSAGSRAPGSPGKAAPPAPLGELVGGWGGYKCEGSKIPSPEGEFEL